MLPVIIEDLILKALDKKTHPERKQFYIQSLVTIKAAIDKALSQVEADTKKR